MNNRYSSSISATRRRHPGPTAVIRAGFRLSAAAFLLILTPVAARAAEHDHRTTADRAEIVYCRDPARDIVLRLAITACQGEIVSDKEAEAARARRFAAIRQSLNRSEKPAFTKGRRLKMIGTGFFITTEGKVLTNNHVIANCALRTIRRPNGRLFRARVIATDRKMDLALLDTTARNVPTVSFRHPALPRDGEAANLLGYPNLGAIAPTVPQISPGQVRVDRPAYLLGPRFLIAADVRAGNSGGPVIDGKGNVMGIVYAQIDVPATLKKTGLLAEDTAIAIRNIAIEDFLDRNGIRITYSDSPALPGGDSTAILKAAERFIVRVGCWR